MPMLPPQQHPTHTAEWPSLPPTPANSVRPARTFPFEVMERSAKRSCFIVARPGALYVQILPGHTSM